MAKKVRGSTTTHRPGGQGPSRNRKTSSTGSSQDVFDAADADPSVDIDGAVETVAMQATEIGIEEAAPATARSRRSRRGMRVKADSLEARSVAEDTFVREDLRSIGIIAGVLVAGLVIAWVLLVAMNVAGLY